MLAGQQRAKANGVRLDRPSKINDGMKSAVKLLREGGHGYQADRAGVTNRRGNCVLGYLEHERLLLTTCDFPFGLP